MAEPRSILAIRLGALGDLVLCCPAFQAIRTAHPTARIALLTMPAFADFTRSMPWFDEVIVDRRAPLSHVMDWVGLLSQIRRFNPCRVYDLQGKFRQTILYMLLGGGFTREWSGAAPLCSHPRVWPPQIGMHFTDFIAAQMQQTGITVPMAADMTWCDAPLSFDLPKKFVVLIPSCAAGREYKRWPVSGYADIANRLQVMGISTIAVGGKGDSDLIGSLRKDVPHVLDLSGQTSLLQLGGLARRAVAVLGNDTGPSHIMAACGAPSLTLFSGQVNPVWSRPCGQNVRIVQEQNLSDLSPDRVWGELQPFLGTQNLTDPIAI